MILEGDMNSKKSLLIALLFLAGVGFCQDQSYDEKNNITNFKASIAELEKKLKNYQKDASRKIDEMKKGTDDQIANLFAQHSALQKQFEDSYKGLLNKISEQDKDTNKQIQNILEKYLAIQYELEEFSRNQNIIKEQQSINYQSLNENIGSLGTSYNDLNDKVNELNDDTDKEITIIKKDVLLKFLFTASAILFSLSMTFLIAVMFKRKFKKVNLLEESIKLDARMSEILENQLILMKKELIERKTPQPEEKIDHTLPISVGSEIFRMRRRIENMDEDTKGLNSLKNALTRLENEFGQQGYAMNDLTGQPYADGLTVKVVNAIEQDDLEHGTQIISRMIMPQICYKGVTVSHGEVEITVSSKDMK